MFLSNNPLSEEIRRICLVQIMALVSHVLHRLMFGKIFLSETIRPIALIFGM